MSASFSLLSSSIAIRPVARALANSSGGCRSCCPGRTNQQSRATHYGCAEAGWCGRSSSSTLPGSPGSFDLRDAVLEGLVACRHLLDCRQRHPVLVTDRADLQVPRAHIVSLEAVLVLLGNLQVGSHLPELHAGVVDDDDRLPAPRQLFGSGLIPRMGGRDLLGLEHVDLVAHEPVVRAENADLVAIANERVPQLLCFRALTAARDSAHANHSFHVFFLSRLGDSCSLDGPPDAVGLILWVEL